MGQRLLEVNADILIHFIKGLTNSPPRYEVVADAIPKDATILSIRQSIYHCDIVEVELTSLEWEEAPLRTRVIPQLRAIIGR